VSVITGRECDSGQRWHRAENRRQHFFWIGGAKEIDVGRRFFERFGSSALKAAVLSM